MNTNQIKRFAQAARKKLIEQVGARLEFVLHTDSAVLREKTEALRQLQVAINTYGKVQVIEKIAYTWFNRLIALRFMDVNNYQPIGTRVVTPKEGYTLPEILEEAKHGHITDELPVKRVNILELLDGIKPSNNPQNEAYKELLTGACNHLNKIFPFLFERINDYTELLMPDDLISQYSIIQDVRDGMQPDDCKEVEIIGWLYQFYISERKDEVFASKTSVKKEDIPAATQLFTPRWIVEYMVQNTVGKLWLQNRPNSKIRDFMPYYIDSPSSKATDYLKLNSIEELMLLDQACGSGHILVYGFELLYKIYEEEGYNPSDIPQLIIEKNLYGFEIDERAAQLAGFALMMKARSYHRRFFKKEVEPKILCYSDLTLAKGEVKSLFHELTIDLPDSLNYDFELLRQATNLGSLIQPKTPLGVLKHILDIIEEKQRTADIFSQPKIEILRDGLLQLIPLCAKYHCVVDNPPYMGSGNMNKELSEFVKTNYPDSKADLMACFMEAGLAALYYNGLLGMINQHSWMFLSSYEKLRNKLISKVQIDTLLHLGPHTFPEIGGEVVQNASFTLCNSLLSSKGSYIRLLDFENSELKRSKTLESIQNPKCEWFYTADQKDFEKIPGSPISYWLSKFVRSKFEYGKINDSAILKIGLSTGDNNRFIRLWHEIQAIDLNCDVFNGKKWFALISGGEKRKWYGNHFKAIQWIDSGEKIKSHPKSVIRNESYYFKSNLDWSRISTDFFGVRFNEPNYIFDTNSGCVFSSENDLVQFAAYLNSKVSNYYNTVLSPTISFQVGDVSKLPFVKLNNCECIIAIAKESINICKKEYDKHEYSWNFQISPLFDALLGDIGIASTQFSRSRILSKIQEGQTIKDAYNSYVEIWSKMFLQLHNNEEELNRQFIEIYGLQDELTPDVPLEEITILKEESSIVDGELVFHPEVVMAQFISYAVGCMFGRYSLDKEGLILANQGETLRDYLEKTGMSKSNLTFVPDEDNIIPVLDDEWFEDDITGRFNEFLKANFGMENFDKNLLFVEESLGMDIRKYFTRYFYSDHIQRYKKRPIYWMISSLKGSFNVLIYMHRYTPDTLNQILNGYLREYKGKISTQIEHLDHIIVTGSSSEATKATKQQDKYRTILLELQEYERDILYPLASERIAIDLDDGVLVNYNKFGMAIKEVAGLNDKVTKKKVKEFDWINGEEIR